LISNFCRVLHVVCFLLGNSPASEFYMPTFWNTLFHLYKQVFILHLPAYEDETHRVFPNVGIYKIQTPGNYPEENIQLTFSFKGCGLRFMSTYQMMGWAWLAKTNLTDTSHCYNSTHKKVIIHHLKHNLYSLSKALAIFRLSCTFYRIIK
jgi:hypothetical protein